MTFLWQLWGVPNRFFRICNTPLSNCVRTKEQSWGWEKKICIFLCLYKGNCKLFFLFSQNSKVAYWTHLKFRIWGKPDRVFTWIWKETIMIKEKLTLAGMTGSKDTIGNLCNNRQSVMTVQKRIKVKPGNKGQA